MASICGAEETTSAPAEEENADLGRRNKKETAKERGLEEGKEGRGRLKERRKERSEERR